MSMKLFSTLKVIFLSSVLFLASCGGNSGSSGGGVLASGLQTYRCGDQLCTTVSIHGYLVEAVVDSGALGEVWVTPAVAAAAGLHSTNGTWVPNSFGPGSVWVVRYAPVTVCDNVTCQKHSVYGVEMFGADVLWGLNIY